MTLQDIDKNDVLERAAFLNKNIPSSTVRNSKFKALLYKLSNCILYRIDLNKNNSK